MADRRSWRSLTDALVQRPSDLRRAARAAGAHLVGVVGFSGSWRHNPRRDAEQVAHATLLRLLQAARERTTPWCVSGATDLGVPALAYRAADALGLPTVGVTAAAARSYPLARLDHLVIVGRRFGDESSAFVDLCDELWMIGGGPQSEAEVRLAASMGKPIVVATGLGGRAEALDPEALPTARWIAI